MLLEPPGRSTEDPHLLQVIVETIHYGSDPALEKAMENHSSRPTLPKKTIMAALPRLSSVARGRMRLDGIYIL